MTNPSDGYRIDDAGNVIVDVGEFSASISEDGTITLIVDAADSNGDGAPERDQLERLYAALLAAEQSRTERPDYWAVRASVQAELGAFDEAAGDLTRAVELRDTAEYRVMRAGVFCAAGRYHESIADYEVPSRVSAAPETASGGTRTAIRGFT